MKYDLRLEGYPRDDICDPSNLSASELFTLHESLKDGTCSFKPLPAAAKVVLQATVKEQEGRGENPWGKRKRRGNAGKPNKKRKVVDSTVCHSNNDPSCAPSNHRIHETNSTVQSDSHGEDSNSDNSDGEDTPDGDIGPENGTSEPRKMARTRVFKAVNPVRHITAASSRPLTSKKVAHCSLSTSATASASSSAHVSGLGMSTSMGMNAAITEEHTRQYHGGVSNLLPSPLQACRSVNYDDESESGEDELEQSKDDDDPLTHLNRCIEFLGGNPEDD